MRLGGCLERCVDNVLGVRDISAKLGLEKLKTACPTLVGLTGGYLRLSSDTHSLRSVKMDTEQAGGCQMLKAGSLIQMTGGVTHTDRAIFGE